MTDKLFEVLGQVNLGSEVNMKVRLYRSIYWKISTEEYGWKPETELERRVLLGFRAVNSGSEAFGVYMTHGLNHVEINDRPEMQRLFLEMAYKKLYGYYAYAWGGLLQEMTIKEIREAAISEGIRLPGKGRKAELIAEFNHQLRQDEEETAMTKKITTEQAVEAVKAADTHEAIHSELMKCTKAGMVEVYEMLTGKEYGHSVSSVKKGVLANVLAELIIKHRKDRAYQELPILKKIEILCGETSRSERIDKAYLMSVEELKVTARNIGLEVEDDEDRHDVLADDIVRELTIQHGIAKIEGDIGNIETLKSELINGVRREVLKRLVQKLGIQLEDRYYYSAELKDIVYLYYKEQAEKKADLPDGYQIATVKDFREAFDKRAVCFGDILYAKIPDVRRALNWPRNVFDEMLRNLRDVGVIQLRTGDASLMTLEEVKDCFYDENGFRRGSITWETGTEGKCGGLDLGYYKDEADMEAADTPLKQLLCHIKNIALNDYRNSVYFIEPLRYEMLMVGMSSAEFYGYLKELDDAGVIAIEAYDKEKGLPEAFKLNSSEALEYLIKRETNPHEEAKEVVSDYLSECRDNTLSELTYRLGTHCGRYGSREEQIEEAAEQILRKRKELAESSPLDAVCEAFRECAMNIPAKLAFSTEETREYQAV